MEILRWWSCVLNDNVVYISGMIEVLFVLLTCDACYLQFVAKGEKNVRMLTGIQNRLKH
jgi:hypothetical protein